MDLFERAIFFIIGAGVGFILGFIVARLREIKEELDEVDECVKHCHLDHDHIPTGKRNARVRDDRGFMRIPLLAEAMLLLVLGITVYAAFASQRASNQVEASQERIATVTQCNQVFLNETIEALNARTEFSTEQARSNVELQRSQSKFLAILLLVPPASEERQADALAEYFDNLTEFVALSTRTANTADNNPYPTVEELNSCLNQD